METERLILRDWAEADWPAYFRNTNTPAVMRWLGGVLDQQKQDEHRQRLETYARDHGHTFWAVQRKADGGHLAGEVLGFCGLRIAQEEGGPVGDFEIGWRLREDAWGRGYAREAASAAMQAGFVQFGAPHIVALTVEGNAGSWGLMERLGMQRRPDLEYEHPLYIERYGPIIVYSITREEWERQL